MNNPCFERKHHSLSVWFDRDIGGKTVFSCHHSNATSDPWQHYTTEVTARESGRQRDIYVLIGLSLICLTYSLGGASIKHHSLSRNGGNSWCSALYFRGNTAKITQVYERNPSRESQWGILLGFTALSICTIINKSPHKRKYMCCKNRHASYEIQD